jgi:hypothetical protein
VQAWELAYRAGPIVRSTRITQSLAALGAGLVLLAIGSVYVANGVVEALGDPGLGGWKIAKIAATALGMAGVAVLVVLINYLSLLDESLPSETYEGVVDGFSSNIDVEDGQLYWITAGRWAWTVPKSVYSELHVGQPIIAEFGPRGSTLKALAKKKASPSSRPWTADDVRYPPRATDPHLPAAAKAHDFSPRQFLESGQQVRSRPYFPRARRVRAFGRVLARALLRDTEQAAFLRSERSERLEGRGAGYELQTVK